MFVALAAVVTDWESQWPLTLTLGVGLGLVIDEFPHWIGNIKELNRNVTFMRSSFLALVVAEFLLFGIFAITAQ